LFLDSVVLELPPPEERGVLALRNTISIAQEAGVAGKTKEAG
jgi:hypothetical protein